MTQIPAAIPDRRCMIVIAAAAALHVVTWTLLPLVFEGSIRLDVAEHVFQGQEWRLAYPKHPPFSMWLVALVSEWGPARYFGVYLCAQMLALGGLLFAALLMLRIHGRAAFALAMLIGLASPFLTYIPIELNHNIGVMPFWGLALLSGFLAFEFGRLRDWLLFGAAVGGGMWAKYSILHLVAPLAIAFFLVPTWRQRTMTVGPWLSGLLAAAIMAPQVATMVESGGGALHYALRTSPLGVIEIFKASTGFALSSGALLAVLATIPVITIGLRPMRQSLAQGLLRWRTDRFQLYLDVAFFGPIVLIILSSFFGVRPRTPWLTPVVLSGALWWTKIMLAAGPARLPDRAVASAGSLWALFAVAFCAWQIATPWVVRSPEYVNFDGPALARLAEQEWTRHNKGPIPYLVSFGQQKGRQAAGSIVFDLPGGSRPSVFEEASARRSPWISPSDVARKGALVVSTRPLTDADRVAGREILDQARFERPTVRPFRQPRAIYFGIVRGQD